MKSLSGRGIWWTTHCAVSVFLVIALLLLDQCSCHPAPVPASAGVVGNPNRRPHGPLPARSGHPPLSHPRQQRRLTRPVVRPAECKQETIFTDCFLCGKIAEANLIYRQCCERDPETVNFCNLLLS